MKNLLLSLFGFGAAADETTPAWAVGRPERQGHARRKTDRWRPVTRRQMQALYERPDSFTDLLPWTEYDPDTQCFMLDDGRSVGALFEIFPITSEARPDESMQLLHQRLQHIITDAIPEEDPP
ncbi:MAG: TraC family protein, partial [Lysobacterales bacterium]